MKNIIFILMVVSIFFSCKKDDPTPPTPAADKYVSITVDPTYGNQTLYLDSVFTTSEGYKVKFTDLKFYVSALRNGTDTLTKAALFDFSSTGNLLTRIIGDYNKFSVLQGNIGVIQSLNHLDPSAFPNDSPLNISNAGTMHWGWNTGYIFISIEGKTDTIPDANLNLNHSFSFHVGTDNFLETMSFSNVNWQSISDNENRFKLKLDLLSFLQSPTQAIDLKNEFLSHSGSGQEVLALKVAQNFKQALTAQ
jgi:hypothetical protein